MLVLGASMSGGMFHCSASQSDNGDMAAPLSCGATAHDRARMKIHFTSAGDIQLGAQATKVAMAASGGTQDLASRVSSLSSGSHLYLVLSGLQTTVSPGIFYSVYLDQPDTARPTIGAPHFVARLNFYDATSVAAPDLQQSFDITETARRLAASGNLSRDTHVTIAPDGVPEKSAKPTLACIQIVEQ